MNMQQPFSIEGTKLIADAHDNKDASVMHSSLLMLEIQANALEQERRNRQLMNEQFHIARLQRETPDRGALMVIRNILGAALIKAGEWLRPATDSYPDNANTVMKA